MEYFDKQFVSIYNGSDSFPGFVNIFLNVLNQAHSFLGSLYICVRVLSYFSPPLFCPPTKNPKNLVSPDLQKK